MLNFSTADLLSGFPIARIFAALAAMSFVLVAQAEPVPQWVVGSFVDVRAHPSKNSEIVHHLTANTPVVLVARENEFCEINWRNLKHGFIDCNLLGGAAIRIEDVGSEALSDGNPNPQYSPTRAFWVEPTLDRLIAAGHYFQRAMLSKQQEALEKTYIAEGIAGDRSGKMPAIKRPTIPEFEAMKELLRNGQVAPHSQLRQTVAWSKVREFIKDPAVVLSAADAADFGYKFSERFPFIPSGGSHIWLYQQIDLPDPSQSYFGNIEAVGAPGADAEMLSAQFQIPRYIKLLSKPAWHEDIYNGRTIYGAWDINEVEMRLKHPVYEVALSENGQVSIGKTEAPKRVGENLSYCGNDFYHSTSSNVLPGYKKIDPYVFFRRTTLSDIRRAKVSRGNITLRQPPIDSSLHGHAFVNATVTEFDLNGCGVADIVVWEVNDAEGYIDQDQPGSARTRLIFVNAGGQWYLLDVDVRQNCAD